MCLKVKRQEKVWPNLETKRIISPERVGGEGQRDSR